MSVSECSGGGGGILNGTTGRLREKAWRTHTSWNLPASLSRGWEENLQRCKPSLGVQLAVSKLLWELRASILQQAIPLCLSFCLSVLNSPSALIHSHIQFPALSIHHSPHFVSADFIRLSQSRSSHPEAAGEPPPAAPICWRRAPRRRVVFYCTGQQKH